MSHLDVVPGCCTDCPEGDRIMGGACDREKAQKLCISHFGAYVRRHAKCKSCWPPALNREGPTGEELGRMEYVITSGVWTGLHAGTPSP